MKAILFIFVLSTHTSNVSLETVEFDSYEACERVARHYEGKETTSYSIVHSLCHLNYAVEKK